MKLRYQVISKLNNLSNSEMKLFIYLVQSENQSTGLVEGVYYRDVMKHTCICKQSFYNALKGLEEKKIVTVQKNSAVDYDVLILDNACPTERERSDGYINLNRKVFHSKEFRKLKAHEKYLLFEFLKRTHEGRGSMRIKVKHFYEEFVSLLCVKKRVFRSYLHNLKKFFSIGIKNGNYYITYLHSVFKKCNVRDPEWKSERSWHLEQLVKKECHRLHISYTDEALSDTAYLAVQYKEYMEKPKDVLKSLMNCIRTSIAGIRYSERELENRYVHRLMKKEIGIA